MLTKRILELCEVSAAGLHRARLGRAATQSASQMRLGRARLHHRSLGPELRTMVPKSFSSITARSALLLEEVFGLSVALVESQLCIVHRPQCLPELLVVLNLLREVSSCLQRCCKVVRNEANNLWVSPVSQKRGCRLLSGDAQAVKATAVVFGQGLHNKAESLILLTLPSQASPLRPVLRD